MEESREEKEQEMTGQCDAGQEVGVRLDRKCIQKVD